MSVVLYVVSYNMKYYGLFSYTHNVATFPQGCYENDDVIINASPIEDGHCLLVPDRLHGQQPQILTERSITLAIRYVKFHNSS